FPVGDGDPAAGVPCGRGGQGTAPPAQEPPPLTPPGEAAPPAPRAPAPAAPAPAARRRTTLRLSVARRLRRGALAVTCRLGGPGRCAVVVRYKGRQVGRGSARAGRTGRALVQVRLTRALRRTLAERRGGVRVTLTATARADGRAAVTRRTTTLVRR
ncbi:hypothetical protein, partial [Conexibacter sp. CPCC 205762]|uniref:hypothetical protein n=1 Tax=Conexibacter sp. CPCC 205762 TaxID=3064573 RepID=UPI002717BC32